MVRVSSLAFIYLLVTGANATVTSSGDYYDSNDVNDVNDVKAQPNLLVSFKEWVTEHKREYKSDTEFLERFAVWAENDAYINLHNSRTPTPNFTLGHNHFSDMTNDEYQRYNFLGRYAPPLPDRPPRPVTAAVVTEVRRRHLKHDGIPKEVDWVAEGAVTPIKNQGQCGSCWSFSAVGAVESAMYLKNSDLMSLSEQQLLDCDKRDDACRGGLMDTAFKYIEGAGGLCSFDTYPYLAKKEKECMVDECSLVEGSDVVKFIDVFPGNEDTLKAAIAEQPVSVGIDAAKLSFQLYKEGVYDADCGTALDHGVVAVGYGKDEKSGEDYWLIRNSWGEAWGDNGYIKIAREAESPRQGKCGIYMAASRPITE